MSKILKGSMSQIFHEILSVAGIGVVHFRKHTYLALKNLNKLINYIFLDYSERERENLVSSENMTTLQKGSMKWFPL